MPWLFGRARRRKRRPAGPALGRIVRSADRSTVEREWSLRFEEGARRALANLADALSALRASQTSEARARHLAGTRDALDRFAQESTDATLSRACQLFSQILGAPRQSLAIRLDAAALALETLTFLVVAESGERRQRAAEALRQLELAVRRTEAA